MKKMILVLMLLALLFLYSKMLNTKNEGVYNMEKIEFVEIGWAGIDWDQIEFSVDLKLEIPYDIKSITTKEEAVKIGLAVAEVLWTRKEYLDYKSLTVVHSAKDNIWRFDYSINQSDKNPLELIDCGGFYVAINGNNGEIIKMWIDE